METGKLVKTVFGDIFSLYSSFFKWNIEKILICIIVFAPSFILGLIGILLFFLGGTRYNGGYFIIGLILLLIAGIIFYIRLPIITMSMINLNENWKLNRKMHANMEKAEDNLGKAILIYIIIGISIFFILLLLYLFLDIPNLSYKSYNPYGYSNSYYDYSSNSIIVGNNQSSAYGAVNDLVKNMVIYIIISFIGGYLFFRFSFCLFILMDSKNYQKSERATFYIIESWKITGGFSKFLKMFFILVIYIIFYSGIYLVFVFIGIPDAIISIIIFLCLTGTLDMLRYSFYYNELMGNKNINTIENLQNSGGFVRIEEETNEEAFERVKNMYD